jgi:hypothetical protein
MFIAFPIDSGYDWEGISIPQVTGNRILPVIVPVKKIVRRIYEPYRTG